MKNIKTILTNLIAEESGQDLIEYALVAALVALGAVATMGTLASTIRTAFTDINNGLSSAL